MRWNKSTAARAITIVVLVGALGAVVIQRGGWKRGAETAPQDVIYSMLDAARAGDVGKYMDSYTAEMQKPLREAAKESPNFAQYLKDSNAAIKGIAIMDPQQVSDSEVKARVEYVFQDRNEVQFMYLEKTGRGWKIARVDSTERVKTLIPYGTPVR